MDENLVMTLLEDLQRANESMLKDILPGKFNVEIDRKAHSLVIRYNGEVTGYPSFVTGDAVLRPAAFWKGDY